MTAFAYRARMLTGKNTEGIIDAPDERGAREQLRKQKLTVFEIKESGKSILDALAAINPFKPTVRPKDLVLFSRQLSTLVSAGIPLVQGLSILEEQVEGKFFQGVVK